MELDYHRIMEACEPNLLARWRNFSFLRAKPTRFQFLELVTQTIMQREGGVDPARD